MSTLIGVLLLPALIVAQAPPSYVPERVYDTRRQTFTDFEVMLAEIARADVIVIGEQHGDPNTHRLQLAALEGLRRRRVPVTVSLEMFERDVQDTLDQYLAGSLTEAEFLQHTRPWPRFATDYRAIVELAKAEQWPVVAANVPRRIAAEVAKTGKEALKRLREADRALYAQELHCPQDAYFERFAAAMGGHSAAAAKKPEAGRPGSAKPGVEKPGADKPSVEAPPADPASIERYFLSQCLKDETMAESIAMAVDRRRGEAGAVVHLTGAFHSDFGLGTVERVRRRLPGKTVIVISILPVGDLDALAPGGEELRRGEFLVYTITGREGQGVL